MNKHEEPGHFCWQCWFDAEAEEVDAYYRNRAALATLGCTILLFFAIAWPIIKHFNLNFCLKYWFG